MTKEEIVAKLQSTRVELMARGDGMGNGFTSPVSIEAVEGALLWVEQTYDDLPPRELRSPGLKGALDFHYGDAEKWAVITVHNLEFRECTSVFGNLPYDANLLGVANPSVEQIKRFLKI